MKSIHCLLAICVIAASPCLATAAPITDQALASSSPNDAAQTTQLRWEVLRADGDIAGVLARWGNTAGWRVVWRSKEQIAVPQDATITADTFAVAADALVRQLTAAGYKLEAQAFTNKVLVVLDEGSVLEMFEPPPTEKSSAQTEPAEATQEKPSDKIASETPTNTTPPASPMVAPVAAPVQTPPESAATESPETAVAPVTAASPAAADAGAKQQPAAAPSAATTPAQPVSTTHPAGLPQATPQGFTLRATDLTVRGGLSRWMRELAMQEIVWDLRQDVPVDRELEFEGPLDNALDGLMSVLRLGPVSARACLYTNKVVRIIPATRFCEEPSL